MLDPSSSHHSFGLHALRPLVRRITPFLFLACALLGFSGCLEEPEADAQRTGCEETDGGECDNVTTDRTRYPGYGTNVGQVIAPLEFLGGDGEPMGLGEVFSKPENKVLLLTTSAGWCTACIEEQPKLQALHEEFSDRGLVTMVVLFEKQDYSPADARLAASWKERYALDFHVVADPDFIMRPYYPNGDPSVTPILLMVDVDTMTILDTMVGFDEAKVRAIIGKNI